MDYFKQMGTYALAGSVLTVALYGAFEDDTQPIYILVYTVVVCLASFSLCLVGSALGMFALVEEPPGNADRFVRSMRRSCVFWFIIGALGLLVGGYAVVAFASPA